ncbi:MobA/MobL family protein [Hyphomicrobiaceae bacterium 22]|uniref:MobA/MobL family protein n=1 Tax=Prosthecodimorpha staleyi TaxID=2840188 RepID=A0A947GGZ9_9HYPH|nr:MobA/MobL family protein [Prosthecodimorpha staleyi]
MALYHLHVRNIGRADGRTAVAAAAYRAGETLWNEAEERLSAFGGRREVLHNEIRLPAGAPAWMGVREDLWNAVERANLRRDARLAKEIEFALPIELGATEWLAMARRMADAYTSLGHVVDLAIHTDSVLRNPHVHLMLATNAVGENGFGRKLRDADKKVFVTVARKLWAAVANDALKRAGAAATVDHRSHQARGIAHEPGRHRGPDQAERRSDRWESEAMRTITDMWRWGLNSFEQEVYAEKLADLAEKRRYPELAREDWPPIPARYPGDLKSAAAMQHHAFWHDVQTEARSRAFQREPEDAHRLYGRPDRDEPSPLIERSPMPGSPRGSEEEQVRALAERDTLASIHSLEDAMPSYHALFDALQERMAADGFRTDGPLSDWSRIEASSQRFAAELAKARALDAENRILADQWRARERSIASRDEPVRGQEGRAMPAVERDEPRHGGDRDPEPEREVRDQDGEGARRPIEPQRQEEDFLDWRRAPVVEAERNMPIQAEIDYLDWLDLRASAPDDRRAQLERELERSREIEREEDRDR